jgi:hypothetical protein
VRSRTSTSGPSFADRAALIGALQAGNGPGFEEGEQVLRVLVAAGHPPGTVDLAVLQQLCAANHFEVIGRFSCEAVYEAYLISTANLGYRRSVAPALASPYQDRLLGARGEQAWPGAGAGDVVVIMQIEIQPPRLAEALSLVGEVAGGSVSQTIATGPPSSACLGRRAATAGLTLRSCPSAARSLRLEGTGAALLGCSRGVVGRAGKQVLLGRWLISGCRERVACRCCRGRGWRPSWQVV